MFRRQAAAVGQGFAAAHAGPKTAVGKAVVRLGAAEVVGELALRDMPHDADMGGGGVKKMAPDVGRKIATIPGAAEQRGELAGTSAQHMEHGGELLREQEEAAIGGWLFIPQSMEEAVDGRPVGGHAARYPTGVNFGEEAGDLAPAGSFASLAGFADQDDEEVEAVTSGADVAVKARADEVAKGGQELQEDGGGIGLGMRRKATDGEAGKAVEGRLGQGERCGCGKGLGILCEVVCVGCLGVLDEDGVFLKAGVLGGERLLRRRGGLRLPPAGPVGKQLTTAALYVGERGQGTVEKVICGCHDSTLLRFRFSHKGLRAIFWKSIVT